MACTDESHCGRKPHPAMQPAQRSRTCSQDGACNLRGNVGHRLQQSEVVGQQQGERDGRVDLGWIGEQSRGAGPACTRVN